jgi:hypothetical protein
MGTGRGRAWLSWVLLALPLALFVAGCGAEDHPNEPRPPQAVEVTASISDNRLSVEPNQVGFGDSDQPMSQNRDQPQAELSSSRPLTISFTVSNLTDYNTALQIEGPASETTELVIAQGTNSFKIDLPTGDYIVFAEGVPGTPRTGFSIGPERPSSQNDLLLP